MTELFPFSSALFGGILIGLSAFLLLFSIGRIAGISGITAHLLSAQNSSGKLWRILFIIGLMAGASIFSLFNEQSLPFRDPPTTWLLIIAGLLVGFGTHYGSGCTSGHGVCGIGRFSVRSIVATITFMLFAGITVFVIRHLLV